MAGVTMRSPLTIFNLSWWLAEVPEGCRKANGTPAFKVDKKEGSGNHTPVSLTSITGKVLEQLILETISQHLEDKRIIRSIQHGFTKGKSCLISLITFYEEVTGLVDESGHCWPWLWEGLGQEVERTLGLCEPCAAILYNQPWVQHKPQTQPPNIHSEEN